MPGIEEQDPQDLMLEDGEFGAHVVAHEPR